MAPDADGTAASPKAEKRIGYIGLGDMGGAIATRLVETGWNLVIYARREASLVPFRDQPVMVAGTPREVAEAADMFCICVGYGPQVEDLLFGSGEAAEGLRPDSIVIIQSTIEPDRCRSISGRLERRNVHVIDAPVTGGTARARNGTLTIPCGGHADTIARCMPLLNSQAALVVRAGEVGSGQMMKLLNNTLYAVNLAHVIEATRVGERLGLSRESIWKTIGAGSGGSTALTHYAKSMAADGSIFPPGAVSFPGGHAGLLSKDVNLLRKQLAGAGLSESLIEKSAERAIETFTQT